MARKRKQPEFEPGPPTATRKGEPERLKLDIPWDQAAARLLKVPAKSTPPRVVKRRKKAK